MKPDASASRPEFFSEYIIRMIAHRHLVRMEAAVGRSDIGVLCIQVENFYTLVGISGEEAGLRLLEAIRKESLHTFETVFTGSRLICHERVTVNEFILFFTLPEAIVAELAETALCFRIRLRNAVNRRIQDRGNPSFGLRVGHAWIEKAQQNGFYRLIFKAFCDAQRMARQQPDASRLKLHREFVRILETGHLITEYQPIFDFDSGKITGWEVFSRGPGGSPFHSATTLFSYAVEVGKIFSLEHQCRRLAFEKLGPVSPGQSLFINVHLQTLNDPDFTPGATRELAGKAGLRPEDIVLEFSIGQGIQDFNLLMESLDHYRGQGFRIAVDDVGGGHSSLRYISYLKPDYIKTDLTLTRGVDYNPIKRIMMESFVLLAEKIDARVIAVGVETETELTCLVSLGVHSGQGYGLGRPASPKPDRAVQIPPGLIAGEAVTGDIKCMTPVSHLIQEALQVAPETRIQEVKQLLSDKPPMSSVVMVDPEGQPAGLLMNYNLDRKLSTRYGVSLYYNRAVSRLMDAAPLVVEESMPVEAAARSAMNREDAKIYDDIVVVRNRRVLGTISVQKMLDTLARVQVEMAKGASPLTGLPGNVAIEQEISRRSEEKLPSSFLYIDIDNFKVYNDVYGFENGDRMILFTATVLKEAVAAAGMPGDFVGHVGGDDFVVISSHEDADALCEAILRRFAATIDTFYPAAVRREGFLYGRGRDGVERKYPLATLSIGVVSCRFNAPFSMETLSHRVAEIKKYAKSKPGNAYVSDRRRPLGETGSDPNRFKTNS